jgi:hypothetical protein
MCYEPKSLGLCRRSDMTCPLRDDNTTITNDTKQLGMCYGGNYANMWFDARTGGNCWDSDLITGENERRWRADVDRMANMGVNTIRLYHGNTPTTFCICNNQCYDLQMIVI